MGLRKEVWIRMETLKVVFVVVGVLLILFGFLMYRKQDLATRLGRKNRLLCKLVGEKEAIYIMTNIMPLGMASGSGLLLLAWIL
jgi:hypothetical protein